MGPFGKYFKEPLRLAEGRLKLGAWMLAFGGPLGKYRSPFLNDLRIAGRR